MRCGGVCVGLGVLYYRRLGRMGLGSGEGGDLGGRRMWGGGVGVGGAMESVNLIQFFFFALSDSGRVCVIVS